MSTFDELISEACAWGKARGLHNTEDLRPQFIKLAEELGELAAGIARCSNDKIVDSIGDMLVVMVQFGAVHSTFLGFCNDNDYLRACLAKAMDEIRGRSGGTINGVFIKDEETPDD
jgi:hypothetical protein